MPSTKSGERWYPVVEITSKDLRQRITDVVLAAWEAPRQKIIPPGRTVVHRVKRRDQREQHIAELAERFDRRGPDDVEDAL